MDEIKKTHCIECGFIIPFCICDIKQIKSDDTIDTDTERQYHSDKAELEVCLTRGEKLKKIAKQSAKITREAMPDIAFWWMKFQRSIIGAGGTVLNYADSKINLAIGIGVKELIRKFSFWTLLFLGVVAIIITIKLF